MLIALLITWLTFCEVHHLGLYRLFQFTSDIFGIDIINNGEKINQNLRNDLEILKSKKKNCENFGYIFGCFPKWESTSALLSGKS